MPSGPKAENLRSVDPATSTRTFVAWSLGLWTAFVVSWSPTFGLPLIVLWVPAVWIVNYRRGRAINRKRVAALASCAASAMALSIRGAWLYGPIKQVWIMNVVGVSFVVTFATWVLAAIVLATDKSLLQLTTPNWAGRPGVGGAPPVKAAEKDLGAELASARRQIEETAKRLHR